jgi:hypothetical protein
MKEQEEISEFSIIQVDEKSPTDIECSICKYRGIIFIENDKWIIYKNPNYKLIISQHREYIKWLTLNPDAIKFVLDNVKKILCPVCNKDSLCITKESSYNPMNILMSLQCSIYP